MVWTGCPVCRGLADQFGVDQVISLPWTECPVWSGKRTKEWYSQVLSIKPYFDEPFYVGFQVGGFELGLIPQGEPGSVGPQPLWGVASIETAFQKLLDLGADPLDDVTDVGEGIKVAAVRDPFGNRFGIIENPHFDSRQVR